MNGLALQNVFIGEGFNKKYEPVDIILICLETSDKYGKYKIVFYAFGIIKGKTLKKIRISIETFPKTVFFIFYWRFPFIDCIVGICTSIMRVITKENIGE